MNTTGQANTSEMRGSAVCIQAGDNSLRSKYCFKWTWNWSA